MKINKTRVYSISLLSLNLLFLLGLFAEEHFLLDLINHFRPFLILFFLAVFTFKLSRDYHYNTLWHVFAAFLLNISTFPGLAFTNDPPAGMETLKIAHFNVYYLNDQYEKVAEIILNENPNIISFQEYTPAWHQALLPILDDYELTCRPESRPFGICVATNIPISDNEVIYISSRQNPAIKMTVHQNNKDTQFLFLHTSPPFSQQFFAYRNIYLNEVVDQFNDYENLVIVGDLNITQWSPIYQSFESRLGLKNTLSGFNNTWPNYLPLPILQLDHIMVSEHITLYQSGVLDDIGSDHYPIMTTIGL